VARKLEIRYLISSAALLELGTARAAVGFNNALWVSCEPLRPAPMSPASVSRRPGAQKAENRSASGSAGLGAAAAAPPCAGVAPAPARVTPEAP